MRIRRRPPLPPSPPQTPNFSSNTTPREEREKRGLHQDGDLRAAPLHGWRRTDPIPTPSDPHPQQVFKEEKDSSSSSHKKTLDAQVHNNERINGEEMERSNAKVLSNIIALSNSNNNVGGVKEQEAANNINGKIKRQAPGSSDQETGSQQGSRCSRVNGRGWRCNQQTLIGYSLCEHHLGKGRLRSISSVRVKSNNNVTAGKPKKKEIKIGVVKARSMSSLLDGEQDEDDDDRSVDAMATAESKMGLV